MTKVHNFSAGPCILAPEVLKKAGEAVVNFNDLNLSLLEISHRSKDFVEVMDKAISLVKKVLNVPEGYEVVYLGGGASLGFYISTLNFLKVGGKGAYVNTGTWSSKAIKEAKHVGEIDVAIGVIDIAFTIKPMDANGDTDEENNKGCPHAERAPARKAALASQLAIAIRWWSTGPQHQVRSGKCRAGSTGWRLRRISKCSCGCSAPPVSLARAIIWPRSIRWPLATCKSSIFA